VRYFFNIFDPSYLSAMQDGVSGPHCSVIDITFDGKNDQKLYEFHPRELRAVHERGGVANVVGLVRG
jgi:hypothetical protein